MKRKLKQGKRYNLYTALPKGRTNISNRVKDSSWSVFLHWGAQNSYVTSVRLFLRELPETTSTSCSLGTESRWGFSVWDVPDELGSSETKPRKNLATGIWTTTATLRQFPVWFSTACFGPQNLSLPHQDSIHDETGLPGMLRYKEGTSF